MKSNKSIENKSFTSVNEKADQILENQEEILKELKNSNQKTHHVIGHGHSIDPTSFNEEQLKAFNKNVNNQMYLYMLNVVNDKDTKCEHVFRYSKKDFKIYKIIISIIFGLMLISGLTDFIYGRCVNNTYSFNEILALIVGVMFLTSTLRAKFRFPRSKYLKWGLTKKITTFNGLISYSGFALKKAVKISVIIAGILLGLITIFNFTDGFIFNGVASLISLITLLLGIFLYQYLLACCHDIVVYHFVDPKTYEIKDVVFDNLDITFQRYFYTKEEYLKIYPFFDYYFNKEEAK